MADPLGPAEGAKKANTQQYISTPRRPPSTERPDAIATRVLKNAARHLRDRNPVQLELPLHEQFELFGKPRKT